MKKLLFILILTLMLSVGLVSASLNNISYWPENGTSTTVMWVKFNTTAGTPLTITIDNSTSGSTNSGNEVLNEIF